MLKLFSCKYHNKEKPVPHKTLLYCFPRTSRQGGKAYFTLLYASRYFFVLPHTSAYFILCRTSSCFYILFGASRYFSILLYFYMSLYVFVLFDIIDLKCFEIKQTNIKINFILLQKRSIYTSNLLK
jgi:cellulose synthase/poly-beta-1,6-N-acetylglucosamine synthase-like glycosyltransferase